MSKLLLLRMYQTFSQVCQYNVSSRGIMVHQVPWTIADQPRFFYRGLLIGEMLPSLLRWIKMY